MASGFIQRGDVVHRPMAEYPLGMMLVYMGDGQLLGPADAGLAAVPARIVTRERLAVYPVGRQP